MSRVLLDLDRPDMWPSELREFLDGRYEVFFRWEVEPGAVSASDYDEAITSLRAILNTYVIVGWHCTRLTLDEMNQILLRGMQLPDGPMLQTRIGALVNANIMSREIAARLASRNQASDRNRAGRLWFCFFPPRLAGEHGIGRFFRHRGGEALYNSHESDPVTSHILRYIGIPCVVEADVPIASLAQHGGLVFKIVRRFLISRGHATDEPVEHEDRIVHPLDATSVRRIIEFPELDFVAMTGCFAWQAPLEINGRRLRT